MPGLSSARATPALPGMAFEGYAPARLHIPAGEAVHAPSIVRRQASLRLQIRALLLQQTAILPRTVPSRDDRVSTREAIALPGAPPGHTPGRRTCGKSWQQRAWCGAGEAWRRVLRALFEKQALGCPNAAPAKTAGGAVVRRGSCKGAWRLPGGEVGLRRGRKPARLVRLGALPRRDEGGRNA